MVQRIERLHARAKWEVLATIAVGILATVVGIWAIYQGPALATIWMTVFIIVGPILVYMGLIAYYTYLEKIEESKYVPNPERPEPDENPPRYVYPFGH